MVEVAGTTVGMGTEERKVTRTSPPIVRSGRKPGAASTSPLLKAMRAVAKLPAVAVGVVESPLEGEFRRLYRDDFGGFMDRMMQLERDHSRQVVARQRVIGMQGVGRVAAVEDEDGEAGGVVELAADDGVDRCVELAERLLRELKHGRGGV